MAQGRRLQQAVETSPQYADSMQNSTPQPPCFCSLAHGTSPISFLTSSVHWGPVLQVSRIVTRTGLAVAGLAGELGERVHGKHLEQPPAPARQAPHGGRGLLEPSVRHGLRFR